MLLLLLLLLLLLMHILPTTLAHKVHKTNADTQSELASDGEYDDLYLTPPSLIHRARAHTS
jgi:hypothetical protein